MAKNETETEKSESEKKIVGSGGIRTHASEKIGAQKPCDLDRSATASLRVEQWSLDINHRKNYSRWTHYHYLITPLEQ